SPRPLRSTLFPYTTLFRSDRTCLSPKWMPDGKRITFEAEDGGYHRIFFTNIEGKKPFTDETKHSERSIDFARTTRMGVFLESSRSEEHTSELQSRGHLVCR